MGEPTVVLMGDYDDEHPAERTRRRGLELHGVEVLECKFRDEPLFVGPRKLLLLPLYYLRLVVRFRRLRRRNPDVDGVYLTKFNPLVLPLAAVLAWRAGCPLTYDLYVSLARTAEMRGINRAVVLGVHALERATLRLPDHIVVGTHQLAELYAGMYGVPVERFVVVPPGAKESFDPMPDVEEREQFTVLYWGNFLPHHGVDVVVEAAARFEDENVEFVFLGKGPEREPAVGRAEELGLDDVRFEGRVPWEDLFRWIAASHVALGVFSADRRAMASITNKVCEGVAMARPVLTERSPAVLEWFEHGESVYAVPPEDPEELAAGIRELRADDDLRRRIAEGGHEVHLTNFTPEAIGRRLVDGILPAAPVEP